MVELPKAYVEVEHWAKLLFSRIEELREAYQDPHVKAYFNAGSSVHRAAVRRTSLDLARAMVKMRNNG